MFCLPSLYSRDKLKNVIKKITKSVFIPITVGGGIRSVKDAAEIFFSGADKIAINSAAIINQKLSKNYYPSVVNQLFHLYKQKKVEKNGMLFIGQLKGLGYRCD